MPTALPSPDTIPGSVSVSPPLRGWLPDRALWACLALGVALALFACASVATQSLILGSRDGGWTYAYVAALSVRALFAALVACALAAALLFSVRPGESRSDWPLLLAWTALGVAMQAVLRSVTPFRFEPLFVSDIANAFYSVTSQYDAGRVLSHFDQLRTVWPLHAQSNMPGKLMLLYALRGFSEHPATLAWLTVVVSSAGGVLMYFLTRELFADRRVAMDAAILYLLVPAKLYFFPLMNTVTPVVVIGCALLVLVWLRTARAGYAAALGAALYLLVFFEPLPLVMGLLFAAFVVRAIALRQISWTMLLSHVGVGIAAWLASYALVDAVFGFDLVRTFRKIGEHALRFNEQEGRTYAIWVRANLREFLFGVGVCQAVLFGAALVDGLGNGASWRDRLTRPIVVLCAGTAAVLLATDLIGANRGEVIRLWIFLSCFFQIPAAYVCARLRAPLALMLVVAVTVLQSALGTSMIGFIGP